MRFEDLLHCCPGMMKLRPEGLQLLCWQTKTERSRRGSRIAICNVSLSGSSWLQVVFDLLHQLAPSDYWRGDYVMCAFGTKEINFLAPQTYQSFLYTLRELSNTIINESNWEDGFKSEMGELSKKFTAHSPRCTVVSALEHRNVKHATIQLQGRWKSPSMVQKYQRDRTLLTTAAVAELVKDLRSAWREEDAEQGHLRSDSDLSEDLQQPILPVILPDQVHDTSSASSSGARSIQPVEHQEEELLEDGVRGGKLSLETIESSEAHTQIVATSNDQPPTKVRAVDNTPLFCVTRASLVATRSSCSIHLVDLQAGKLVCNRAPLEMCTVLGSEMPSAGHLCAEVCEEVSIMLLSRKFVGSHLVRFLIS